MFKSKEKFLEVVVSLFVLALSYPSCFAESNLEQLSVSPQPTIIFPKTSLGPEELAVIVNDADPLSVEIAQYYKIKRNIPERNMIHISFKPGSTTMNQAEFTKIKTQVDLITPQQVQAFALTWSKPYRVDCMSITTAFALGFDSKYCANGCELTKPNPYFNSPSNTPYKMFKMRPTMSLAGTDFNEVKKLIDRGILSDNTLPSGTGYLLDTTDKNRNVRAAQYDELLRYMDGIFKLERVKSNFIENKTDVMFYFTGTSEVAKVTSNTFIPGAIADHLTSAGGQLTDSLQMSILRWLEAGASGSYGAVVEPCNFPGKFPIPGIVINYYINGETLIEAYWKSVALPGQGIFVGEPLAKPYGGYKVELKNGELSITTRILQPGIYAVFGADSGVGPYKILARGMPVGIGKQVIKIQNASYLFYRIVRETQKIQRKSMN
ncbi:TIGR03790 family protein [Sulfurirhabdus autotrophica]|uniref:Uncharacterized protein (TIGR03790 family) n=1 Tax=Sulfurirhabdus autotrophica TaxID=1706046 RepID=A0A4R3XVW3_9PROT|nr:TIGR03790 family protein [Sulfurirhabdus autotrophica]TCV83426.1 uncharacterized protein (TIGR03790 family) [Sulfurirhabdus autotrophica]